MIHLVGSGVGLFFLQIVVHHTFSSYVLKWFGHRRAANIFLTRVIEGKYSENGGSRTSIVYPVLVVVQ